MQTEEEPPEEERGAVSASTPSSDGKSSSSSSPSSSALQLSDVALEHPILFLDKIVLAACGTAPKDFGRLERVSNLFRAPSQTIEIEGKEGVQKHTVSIVELALRRMSKQSGRGMRGVALPTTPGAPMPNWTQLLLRELWRGFWSDEPKDVDVESWPLRAGSRKISAACNSNLYLLEDGSLHSSGLGFYGALGTGHTRDELVPVQIGGLLRGKRVRAMSAGTLHSHCLTEDGAVYTWGFEQHGQLGLSQAALAGGRPLRPRLVTALEGKGVCAMSATVTHSLFLTEDGAAYSCGRRRFCGLERCGDDQAFQWEPAYVEALRHVKLRQVACGPSMSYFLTEDGEVWACGDGRHGQLGQGNEQNEFGEPKLMKAFEGVRICAVAAGTHHALFVDEAGAVYSVGDGSHGGLGHGNTERQHVPKLVEALSGVRVCAVSCGAEHSLFLTENGQVYSCGLGKAGRLGHGTQESLDVPTLIRTFSRMRVISICAGNLHSLFISGSGAIWSCGEGKYGSLGHGDERCKGVPRRIEHFQA